MHTGTAKSIAAIALTGLGSALVVGFQAPDAPAAASTTATTSATTSGTTATMTPTTTAAAPTAAAPTAAVPTAATPTTATPAATAAPSSPTTAVAAAATYADGTWTGTVVSEPWGSFQVQAVVSGGRVTDVVVISSPQDGHSSRINSQAVPILTQAAVAAQSAGIDMVSGATWTSQSYITSLQAALDQAKAAAEKAA